MLMNMDKIQIMIADANGNAISTTVNTNGLTSLSMVSNVLKDIESWLLSQIDLVENFEADDEAADCIDDLKDFE